MSLKYSNFIMRNKNLEKYGNLEKKINTNGTVKLKINLNKLFLKCAKNVKM